MKRPGRAMTRTTLVVTLAFVVTQLPYYVVEILHAAKADHLASLRRTAATSAAGNFTQQPSSVTVTAKTPLITISDVTTCTDDVTDDVTTSTDRHQSCVSS